MDDNELSQYYTINFDKFLEMIKQIDSLHSVLSTLLKDHVINSEIESWHDTPIPDLAAYFAIVHELKFFLEDIINNPSEEEIEIMIKYEIKDVVVSLVDLNTLNAMFGTIQELSDRLYEKHQIATNIQ